MYAKIVTLLALFIGSLTGINSASNSAKGDNWTDSGKRVENVQIHVSQDHTDVHNPPVSQDPSRPDRPIEEEPVDEPLMGCHTTDLTPNSEVESFASQLGLTYESVLVWYCSGFSFEVIQAVYDMSLLASVTTDQIYEMRVVEGLSWDEVIQQLGITFSRDHDIPMILNTADQDHSDR